LQIPHDPAQRLSAGGEDLPRRALVEYEAGRLREPELRCLPGFETRHELDGFLRARDVWMEYTIEDDHREMETLRRLGF
jgi:hypothetical protein